MEMSEYIWKKSIYKGGRMGVLLEAGYKITPDIQLDDNSIKITEKIYFRPMLLPYPNSEPLLDEEIKYFCDGFKLVSKQLSRVLHDDFYLILVLRSIQFSECYLQIEDFTGSAILWASETFNFPLPDINVYSDNWKDCINF